MISELEAMTPDQAAEALIQSRQEESQEVETPTEETNEAQDELREEDTEEELQELQDEEMQDLQDEDEAEDEEEVVEEDEPTDEVFTLRYKGKDVELSREELLEKASFGFDYTQKSQALAEQRKELESIIQSTNQKEAVLIERLETLEGILSTPAGTREQLQSLLDSGDIAGYTKLKAKEEERVNMLAKISAQREELRVKKKEAYDKALTKTMESESDLLAIAMPNLATDAGAKALKSYLGNRFGYTEAEISAAYDHRIFIMAEESRLYRELKSGKRPKPKSNNPRIMKKKAARTTAKEAAVSASTKYAEKSLKHFKSSGKKDDAAAAYLAQLRANRR